MIHVHKLTLAAACACLAGAGLPATAHGCSLAPFPSFRDGIHLIGTATADTLPAGAASMQYTLESGTRERAVYGQVVRVERIGGTLAAGLPPGTDRVVLVPWGYDAGCRKTLWTGSARWVEPGVLWLFWSGLRPREQWVNGLPTLDVGDPYHLPYTLGRGLREAEADGDAVMSVDQAFDFLGVLPLWDEHEANGEGAALSLLAWAREHPDLARRFPASVAVREAEYGVRYARLKRVELPLAGSYRFTVSLDGDAPRTFFACTRSAPTTEWNPWRGPDDPYFPGVDAPLHGYTLLLTATTAADSLPVVCGSDRNLRREGYLSILAAPDSVVDGIQLWRGDMELGLPSSALAGDPVLARAARADQERYSRRSQAGEPIEVLARFLLQPDGSVTMEQTSVLDDGVVVVIRGERISRTTIPDPG